VRALYLNEMNAFWRVSAQAGDIDAVLLAGLLHDVGHLALGHFVEEMKDLFEGVFHTDYTIAVLNAALVKLGVDVPPLPEQSSFTIISSDIDEFVTVVKDVWLGSNGRNNAEQNRNQLICLLTDVRTAFETIAVDSELPIYLSRRGTKQALRSIMKSILDGPLDADKIDYLRRDALHSGVMFSNGIDLERFFESLRVCVDTVEKERDTVPALGISDKGIVPVESIITSRYHLFSVVYWHRTTRCITAMLQRVLSEVRLRLEDGAWAQFRKSFLFEFRTRDDRGALDWLLEELGRIETDRKKLLEVPIGKASGGARIEDLVQALRGDRKRYFRVAFELSYSVSIYPPVERAKAGRELLHEMICGRVYSDNTGRQPGGGPVARKNGRESRQSVAVFRDELERAFNKAVREMTGEKFEIDTILLDVPEPGKDQIARLHVDWRNKRSRISSGFLSKLARVFPDSNVSVHPDFVEIRKVSPIAGSLDHALDRWARKIRIFVTRDDMLALTERLRFSTGDIALLWEQVLYSQFGIRDPDQTEFPVLVQ
jgi:hypothetical protein